MDCRIVCFRRPAWVLAALAVVVAAAPFSATAQSLTTGVSGQAQVTDEQAPSLTKTETINVTSFAGAPLSEKRVINVENHPNNLSTEQAFANISATASARYGFLRAAVTADAGYYQSAYVPNGGGGISLVAPSPLPLRPTTLAQAVAKSSDEITVTSPSLAPGDPVPFTFRIELLSARTAIYNSAAHPDGTYSDEDAARIDYSGNTVSSGVISGAYTQQGYFVRAEPILTLSYFDAEAPGSPALGTKTLRAADATGIYFPILIGEIAADLVVGKTYRVEADLLATARSDGGADFPGPGWSRDSSRLDNRGILNALDGTKTVAKVLILPTSADGDFTAKSGAPYDGVEPVATPPTKVAAPRVFITGEKAVSTSKSALLIRGTATGVVTGVLVRVGAKSGYKPAIGTGTWRFPAKLRPGKNLVTVVAKGPGGTSVPARITIVRN